MAAILGTGAEIAPVVAADKLEEASPDAWISALHDGELSKQERLRIAPELAKDRAALAEITAYAELGRLIRSMVHQEVQLGQLDAIWPAVSDAIGLESPCHVPGWEPIGAALREAVADRSQLTAGDQREMADHVMTALPQPRSQPAELDLSPDTPSAAPAVAWWRGLLGPALAVMAVALVMVSLIQNGSEVGPGPGPVIDEIEIFELASANHAEIEEIETAEGVMLHVLQSEDGGPMILMLKEITDQQVDDEGWDSIDWEEI
jgi:hypothetical protein